ncbi:hypothetical protein [Dendronalium phyllosphericum]|nr:hypothetical protein [Dendronalium phyllosphericum]
MQKAIFSKPADPRATLCIYSATVDSQKPLRALASTKDSPRKIAAEAFQ